MVSLKQSCAAAATAGVICAGVLIGTPAGAQGHAGPAATVSIQNLGDFRYLYATPDQQGTARSGDLGTAVGGVDRWVLLSPEGAPQGVYQIQLSETNSCIKAVSASTVELATCANNPGKPQRWALNLTPDESTTIESRQYPGAVLTQPGIIVRLEPLSEAPIRQHWRITAD